MDSAALTSLLQSTFGHTTFRANQQAVCEAATDGRDVLLVMPTGAGKSLCYQLPAIARNGTALVISPLIALMDDQAAKLSSLGLRVARIHSGLSRDDSRQACRDYLDGTLQFLFIAPERMRVPNFPQMLAKRKPALIAIDEAHCISAWGHDFRPDYRTLGEHLPSLRPAPVIALTATATPTVQRDIVAQLRLADPALFIHGFRRHNLAIEVVELSKPRRNAFVVNLLKPEAARPAIVYAPSRKSAEELAGLLGRNAAAYHAGLDPATRDRVQTAFLSGKIDTVVATIAFGMGIDKADVRTVIHTALPASVEGYYQEIGRAGRDGAPSRTVLLHSFADRKMHDFFLERDYPAATELARVAAVLTPDLQEPEHVTRRLRMDPDIVAKSLDKLASQGAAAFDIEGNVRSTGNVNWRTGYDAQLNFRRQQIDRMAAFAETQQCRMTALIQHFGDTADGLRPCGHCDFCSPESTTAQTFRSPTSQEQRHLRSILRALDANGRSTGKLFTDLALPAPYGEDRKQFDNLLDALARAGLLTLTPDTFTNPEGRQITYKKAALTHEGRNPDDGDLPVTLREMTGTSPQKTSGRISGNSTNRSRPSKASLKAERERNTASYTPQQQELEAQLRQWRKTEAGKTGKPAFMVFGDSALRAIVIACPRTIPALIGAAGFNESRADRYGAEILAICRADPSDDAPGLPLATTHPPSSRPKAKRSADVVERPLYSARTANTLNDFAKAVREDLTPINYATARGRRRARAYDQAAYRRTDFEEDLRTFAYAQAEELSQPASSLISEAAIAEILLHRPCSLAALEQLPSLRGDLPDSFFEALLDTCTEEYVPENEPLRQPKHPSTAVDRMYVRHSERPDPAIPLTPAQQALDTRLRTWRAAEAERLNLPQFFVLGASTLRNIILQQPRTLADLRSIDGIGPEKSEKFGPAILEVLNA